MARTVGFLGGSSLNELGSIADVQLFFDCVESFAAQGGKEWALITERLYRRYIKLEDLRAAQKLMDEVQAKFRAVNSSQIDLGQAARHREDTRLNLAGSSLASIFDRFFERFAHCRESAEVFHETFKIYQPLRIVIADMPRFISEKNRKAAEYDALVGAPFWKQP